MRACDDDSWWEQELWQYASHAVPDLTVEVEERDEGPRLLGPDGEPVPRPVHKFGFQPRIVWE